MPPPPADLTLYTAHEYIDDLIIAAGIFTERQYETLTSHGLAPGTVELRALDLVEAIRAVCIRAPQLKGVIYSRLARHRTALEEDWVRNTAHFRHLYRGGRLDWPKECWLENEIKYVSRSVVDRACRSLSIPL